jgi:hypothetical protein
MSIDLTILLSQLINIGEEHGIEFGDLLQRDPFTVTREEIIENETAASDHLL